MDKNKYNKSILRTEQGKCFVCSCAEEVLRGTEERKAACHFCPLPRDVYKTPNCANGLFEKWLDAKDLSKRKDLARKIALMEWEV